MSVHPRESSRNCYGPTSLLLLQAVERCNLDCSYCYLPNRAKSGKMSLETVAASIRWLRKGGLLGKSLEVLWHAGEPLLAGVDFYRRAHEIVSQEMPSTTAWKFVFQTNGTLIDDEWASFFALAKAQIGISIDGPRDWHDERRRTWSGKGSFDRTIQGIECLRRHDVPFSTVSVLSEHALREPDRLYNFLRDLGSETFGFNDEEKEGVHKRSLQYDSDSARADAEYFYSVLYGLATRDACYGRIREIGQSLEAMHHLARVQLPYEARPKIASEMSDPFAILNVAFNGTFSTFAPELLGHTVKSVGDFVFGNVYLDTLDGVLNSQKFQLAHRLIQRGVDECRTSCKYYGLCGGGSPSNKYFENGRLDSSATIFCQLSIIAPINAVLTKLEVELQNSGDTSHSSQR